MLLVSQMVLFDSEAKNVSYQWQVVDDVVMGGRSQGKFTVNEQGVGVYAGKVSLDNNGGFSSVRYNASFKDISSYSMIFVKVKGDGKRYQLRLKPEQYDRHSYVHYFETNGMWQEIGFKLSDFYPALRGMRLNVENFSSTKLSHISFLISNKQQEEFMLEIGKIWLR